MRKCYEILPMRVLIKNSYHYDSICGNPFLVRKIRGIGPIPREEYFSRGIILARNISCEEYSSRGFRSNPRTNIFLARNEKRMRNIPREEYSSRGIFLARNNIARFLANPRIFLERVIVL